MATAGDNAMKKEETGGTCYQDAFKMVVDMPDEVSKGVMLVHGTVYSTYFKRRIDHAWVEMGHGDVVIDPTIKFANRADKYYDFAKAEVVGKYSKLEASKWALKTGHYGPWENQDVETL